MAHPTGGGADVAALTDTGGHYSLSVPAGMYNVSAADKPALYPVTANSTNPVTVADGGSVTVNLARSEGGVLAGTVNDNTSSPVAGANEWAVPATAPPPHAYGGSASDSQGHYRIVVPAGVVSAWAEQPSATLPRTAPTAGNPLTVMVGLTTTADFTLSPGGVIVGHITDAASHAALANSRVWARLEPLALAYGAPLSDDQGAYRIVVPGGTTYNVHAMNVDGMYPRTDYPGNPIAVSTGMTVTADLALTQGGMISGVITDAQTGNPIPFANVWARAPGGGLGYGWPISGDDGHYILAVPAGTWRLFARDLPLLYPRTPYPGNPITVTVGANLRADWALTQGGLLTGQITHAHTGLPLPGALVWARATDGNTHDVDYILNPDGTYALVVPAGDYRLRAADVPAGYPSLADPLNPVHVTPGGTTTASWGLVRW